MEGFGEGVIGVEVAGRWWRGAVVGSSAGDAHDVGDDDEIGIDGEGDLLQVADRNSRTEAEDAAREMGMRWGCEVRLG